MEIIGAGFGRTGTMSLKAALEELGFGPCYHMVEVFGHPEHADLWQAAWRGEPVDWEDFLGDYRAAVDWPACTFYEELMERYPDAKVLLSVRDPERWYESVRNTIYELSSLSSGLRFSRVVFAVVTLFAFGRISRGNMVDDIIWEGTFDGRFEDKPYAIGVFERHNEEVKRRVPPDKLLVYEVKEGWGPLCKFLCVEEPDKPFPRLNDTAEMRRRLRTMRSISYALPAILALLAALAFVLARRRARP
jgi:hypothetical protein